MQRKLLFLACFLICVNCFSQQYPFVYYTPKDGLINSRVRAIKQDSKGRLYFITYGGLSVYDGTRFTNYSRRDGLANDVINDIAEWNIDTILVSCNDQKLNMLVNGRIEIYPTVDNFYPTTNRFLKSKTGSWYVIADEGLFLLSGRKFTRLPCTFNGKDLSRNLDHIVEFENYFLITPWANEWNTGIILYDRDKQKVVDAIPREKASIAHIDTRKRIWVNTPRGLQLLNCTSLLKGKLELSPAPGEFSSVLSEKNISLYLDRSGNAWCFSKNKLWKIASDYKAELISSGEFFKGGLNDIFRDREGIVWMALDGAGVIKLKSTTIQLLNSAVPGRSMAFTSIEQKRDTTWLFNRTDNSVYRITENGTTKFSPPKTITAFSMLVNGNKIFFSDTRNLFFIQNKNDPASYQHPRFAFQANADVLGNNIVDPYGAVFQLWKKDDVTYFITVFKDTKKVFEYQISYMADQMTIDEHNRLWMATRDRHILVFRIDPLHPERYLQLEHDFYKGLPWELGPRSITVDKADNIWIGTRANGIYQFRQKGASLQLLRQYTTNEGLSDNFAYTLCSDDNNVWIGTQTGLDKIAYRNGNYVIINIGKNNNIFQTVLRIKIAKNKTVFALNNDGTLLKIKPDSGIIPKNAASFFFTAMKVNDKLSNASDSRFSYQENNFSFSVAATSFLDERSIRYSYWLEGIGNSHWSESSNNSTFDFINLSPGTYTLHVKADFPEGVYPSQTISYSFIILPAWWQTWWFRTMVAIGFVLLCVLIIRNYYKRKLERQKILLERKQAIEKERTRIATDMHDDLGAGLSRIKFLSETIGIKKQQEQPIEEEITKIREYSHQMIDKMGEIVWALNERNDSLSDLIAYTRAYAMEYLSQNGIQCKMEMPSWSETVFLSGEFRRNIFLSVKEVLHNIVKHAQAGHVYIQMEVGKELSIWIRDDGIGFNQKHTRAYSNGLYNIRKRMQDIDGRAEIKSNDGTTVLLSAPLPH